MILAIIRQYWDETRYIRIIGEDGEDDFVSFTAADIQGMYDVELEAGSSMPQDPAAEQQAFIGLLQTIGAVAQTLAPLIQAGAMPPDTMSGFIEKSFEVWRQDKTALIGPLSQMQGAAMGMGPGGGGGGAPVGPESVESNGMNPETGESLAGLTPQAASMLGRYGLG